MTAPRAQHPADPITNPPSRAAAEWFTAIVDHGDLDAAWLVTTWELRMSLAQTWLMETGRNAVETRMPMAEALAGGPRSERWPEFSARRVRQWRKDTFRRFVEHGWELEGKPEPIRPDLVLVHLAGGSEARALPAGTTMLPQGLTVRHVSGSWLVAGIGRTVARPGWPPGEEDLPPDGS